MKRQIGGWNEWDKGQEGGKNNSFQIPGTSVYLKTTQMSYLLLLTFFGESQIWEKPFINYYFFVG